MNVVLFSDLSKPFSMPNPDNSLVAKVFPDESTGKQQFEPSLRTIILWSSAEAAHLFVNKVREVSDCSRGRPESSVFNGFYTEV